ncbi:MAG TPA: DNA-3-methyladenine glycosylase 2 family protein [candidate division Zixibacteria bacterium]|nr:DNA-3-methyladenine glycosylase 2 family protein [candidate division Zixibacteria bacterium]
MIDMPGAMTHLRKADKTMRKIIQQVGPLDVRKERSSFPVLAQSIVSQQLSVKAASTILGRILDKTDGGKLTTESILRVGHAKLVSCGLSRPKARYLIGLAEVVNSGELSFRSIARLADDQALEKLTAVKGIGRWTAEMYLMFSLNRPDVFPVGDGGIRAAICRHYEIERDEYPTAAPEIAEAWRPFRSIACRYLWAHKDNTPVDSK